MNIFFFVLRVCYEKLGNMLKPLLPKVRSDLCVRLRDIAEKQVPSKLKLIVVRPSITDLTTPPSKVVPSPGISLQGRLSGLPSLSRFS